VLGLGCGSRVGVGDNPGDSPNEISMSDAQPEPTPRYLSLSAGAQLLAAARDDAPRLRLLVEPPPDGPVRDEGRVVAVVGREGDYFSIETLDEATLDAADIVIEPIVGLEFYRLRAYVKLGSGVAIEPDPVAAAAQREEAARAPEIVPMSNTVEHSVAEYESNSYPPRQSNAARSKATVREYDVPAQAQVFWPDGSEAGIVRTMHAFTEPGVVRETAAGSLRCFTIVTGRAQAPAGELCFLPNVVSEHERAGGRLLRSNP
jgi:hypothetical protein